MSDDQRTIGEGAAGQPEQADIDLAAAVLDQVFQARSEGQTTLETAQDVYTLLQNYVRSVEARHKAVLDRIEALATRLDAHITAVEQRHQKMFERIDLNTRSREDAEWEVTNLHSVMKTWHQHHVDIHAAVVHVLEVLNLRRDLHALGDVPALPARERPPSRQREHGRA